MGKYLQQHSTYRRDLEIFKAMVWLLLSLNKLLLIWVHLASIKG